MHTYPLLSVHVNIIYKLNVFVVLNCFYRLIILTRDYFSSRIKVRYIDTSSINSGHKHTHSFYKDCPNKRLTRKKCHVHMIGQTTN